MGRSKKEKIEKVDVSSIVTCPICGEIIDGDGDKNVLFVKTVFHLLEHIEKKEDDEMKALSLSVQYSNYMIKLTTGEITEEITKKIEEMVKKYGEDI